MRSQLPRSVLFFLGLALVFLGGGLFYWVNENSSLERVSGRMASFSRPGVITSLDQISLETVSGNLVGTSVLMREANVTEVYGDYVFIVSNGSTRVPVVLLGELTNRQNESQVIVREDQSVRITGTLYHLKDVSAVINEDYIDQGEFEELSKFQVFILAQRILINSPVHRQSQTE